MKATDLNKAMLQSKLIICRPGYSSIMDLAKLNKKAFSFQLQDKLNKNT